MALHTLEIFMQDENLDINLPAKFGLFTKYSIAQTRHLLACGMHA